MVCGVPTSLARVRVSEEGYAAVMPRVAEADGEYLVAWYEPEERKLKVARVDQQLVGDDPVILHSLVDIADLEVASDGVNYLVVYVVLTSQLESGNIMGCVVRTDEVIGPFGISPLDASHRRPAVACNGGDFEVVWHAEAGGDLAHALVDASGHVERLGQLAANADNPWLATDGTDYMLVFTRPDPQNHGRVWSHKIGTVFEGQIYDGECEDRPEVACDRGSSTYLVGIHNVDNELSAVRLDEGGRRIGSPFTVQEGVESDSFALAHSDLNYLMTWQQGVATAHVFGQRVTCGGEFVGPAGPILEEEQGTTDHDPHVTSDGNVFAVVWQEVGEGSEVYIDTVSPYQRHFYSRSEEATAFNQARHIARDPENGWLHVVYMTTGEEADDSILYTHSTNGGEDWFPYEYVGEGQYPAVILNEDHAPWVVYVTPGGDIERAIRESECNWSYATVFDAEGELHAGPPSLAPGYIGVPLPPGAYVVYSVFHEDPPTDCWVYFNEFTETQVGLQETVRHTPSEPFALSPCVAATPAPGGDIIHVSWQEEPAIWYKVRGDPLWPGSPARVSMEVEPQSEPAGHASLEPYGDRVYCVWHGPDEEGGFPGDVWLNSRQLGQGWELPGDQSCSAGDESDFPVMTTDYVSVWHEETVDPNFDIWARFIDRPGAEPLFETGEWPSLYPHVASFWELDPPHAFHCQTVWTETTGNPELPYEVTFGDYVREGEDAMCYEPASFYGVEVGMPEPSRYCMRRGGFRQYRSVRVDSAAAELTYRLPYLNPRYAYLLRAVIYHEGRDNWTAELRGDTAVWVRVSSRPNVPETVWVRIPKQAYQRDAQVELSLRRVAGDFVSLAGLKLFQVEPNGKGYELGIVGGSPPDVMPFKVSPNPFSHATTIRYNLPVADRVSIDIYDTAGRLVRELSNGYQNAGTHAVVWNGRDGNGRRLPAGVYFCRLNANGSTRTTRTVIAE